MSVIVGEVVEFYVVVLMFLVKLKNLIDKFVEDVCGLIIVMGEFLELK